jgi:Sec-independent protein secretion pathway component TatC
MQSVDKALVAGLTVGFVFAMMISLVAGVSALVGLVVEHLWNFVVLGLHHNELHVNFLTAWAATFLFSIITRPFRITFNKS